MDPPPISRSILRFFRRIVRRYFRRQFHAVRLSLAADLSSLTGPLIIIGNHPSWWDPMVSFLLAEELFPHRAHYAPMDARALQRYQILSKLGMFPIDLNTPRGAVQFLRTGSSILASGGILWVTPQGGFADPRERPVTFKPGLAVLAARVAAEHGSCAILPLAIEYPFWNERLPECLLRIGQPLTIHSGEEPQTIDLSARNALAAEMDTLAHLSLRRDPAPFRRILSGTRGVGGIYSLGKRLKAILLRQPYIPDHIPESSEAVPNGLFTHPAQAGLSPTERLEAANSASASVRSSLEPAEQTEAS
jgi:1-acyl-sn-glycerol-3-phosphate acyltransferase